MHSFCQTKPETYSDTKAFEGISAVERPLFSKAALRCPECDSIIYSRKSKLCGVCSATLPEEFHLTRQEEARLKQMLEAERNRHRQWLTRYFNGAMSCLAFSD